MDKRVLGKSGIEVSPLGMGCMGITHASGDPMPDDEAVSVIRQTHEMGYTFFDAAECYAGRRADGTEAHSEDVVGAALEPVRDEVVIATKFGVTRAPERPFSWTRAPRLSALRWRGACAGRAPTMRSPRSTSCLTGSTSWSSADTR